MTKILFMLIVLFIGNDSASVYNWRDKFTKMIENGRTLNCSKINGAKGGKVIRLHEIPLHSSKRYENADINSSYYNPNSSCNLELEHVELHFNITNVFEDNSENHPYSGQQQFNEYEEENDFERADNATNIESMETYNSTQYNLTDHSAKPLGKKNDEKSVNSPVYVIFT